MISWWRARFLSAVPARASTALARGRSSSLKWSMGRALPSCARSNRHWTRRIFSIRGKFSLSIQRLPVPIKRDQRHDEQEKQDRRHVRRDFHEAVSFQQYAARDTQEMGEREGLAKPLRPLRHTPEREHEAGQQDGRQKEKHRHLHCLKLVSRERG